MRLLLGAALALTPPAALAQAPSAPAPTTRGDVAAAAEPSVKAAPVAPASAEPVAPVAPAPKVDSAAAPVPEAAEPVLEAAPSRRADDARWEDPTVDAPVGAGEEPESLGWTLLRTLLVLGAVVASIYLTLNVGLRRMMGLQAVAVGRQPLVSVVERLPLDQRRSLFVVKAADEYLLVGGGEAGLQLLSKLDSEAVERIRAQRPQTNVVPLSPFLQKLLSRRSGGSPSQPPAPEKTSP
jgi:flagellar protein FliO/FliZ